MYPLDITAIVSVCDDGSSTGRLREEFNTPAVGDIRKVLVALSQTENSVENLLKENNIFVLEENCGNLDIFAQKIMSFNPDFAISMSFWVNPFDWLPIQDSLIAEKLESKGINVICHPTELNYNFFDKNKTNFI